MQDINDYKFLYYISYKNYIKLEIYTNTNWAGDQKTKKSNSKYVIFLNKTITF